jgi:uncharacterized membrane protein YfcA
MLLANPSVPQLAVIAAISALGGAVNSIAGGGTLLTFPALLLATTDEQFRALVPWLVFGATVLFALQGPVMKRLRTRASASPTGQLERPLSPTTGMLIGQFVVGIYGGYFGAGAGIVMLAVFGLMGLTNIHQMNGLKNFNGICFNGIAAITFAVMGQVNWPIGVVMAVGSSAGGYLMSGLAQKVPQLWVRNAVTAIGFASAIWLFVSKG